MDNSLTNAGKLPRKSRQKKASYLMKSRFQTAHFEENAKKKTGRGLPYLSQSMVCQEQRCTATYSLQSNLQY